MEGFRRKTPFGDIEAVKAAIGPATAGIIVEPIQGEGGVRMAPPSFFRELRKLCNEHKLMLVFDEVQTGVGRTGKLFAYEHTGIQPDIMAIAKGIGGGFPFGAFLTTREAGKGMVAGTHGTTFGGNPLATAIGNAVLDVVLAPGFLDQVKSRALLLKQRLAELRDRYPQIIAEVRGEGLMLGLRIADKFTNGDFAAAVRDQHMLVIPAGENVVRLLPPLTIGEGDIAEAISRLDAACRKMTGASAA